MNFVPIILFVVLIVALLGFSVRARRRQAEMETRRAEQIVVGSEVMTTSGLYGVVVARNDDDSAQLAIAPGVEVKWTFAALREVTSLPDRYRPGVGGFPAPRPRGGEPTGEKSSWPSRGGDAAS